jgi:trans-2,3-dihydro-3-hydroxyanthranilate isomerase
MSSIEAQTGPLVLLYDAFAATPFGGNTAGIVLLEPQHSAPAGWMQLVARELAAPTTGFVDLPSAQRGDAQVRFFTQRQEIHACGHVTVAVATALLEMGVWQAGATVAVTATGGRAELVVHRDQQTGTLLVELAQRLLAPPAAVDLGVADLAGVLGEVPLADGLPVLRAGTGLRHLLVPVGSVAELGRLRLDAAQIAALSAWAEVDTIGVFTVVACDGPVVQVCMRDLCAGIGAVEEPASGTTTAALAFALADQQLLTPDRSELQVDMGAEMGRPSSLWARVEFTGQRAVLVWLCGMAERVLIGRLARRPPSAAPA